MNLNFLLLNFLFLFRGNFVDAVKEFGGGEAPADPSEFVPSSSSNIDARGENEGRKSVDKGIFFKEMPKILEAESEKIVEKMLKGGPFLEINFFKKIINGRPEERAEIGKIMKGKEEGPREKLAQKEGKRSEEEIGKISELIEEKLLTKYKNYVEKMVDEGMREEDRQKMIKWHFKWNDGILDEEGIKENQRAMEIFVGKMKKFEEGEKGEEEKLEMAKELLGHSLKGIVEKFVGETLTIRRQLIGWFLSEKGSEEQKNGAKNNAEIVENGNAEERRKILVNFFMVKSRSDLVEEMERKEENIVNPEKMTWKKAVEKHNFERLFGKNAKKIREEEIKKIVDEIVEGNAYQKIELFSQIGGGNEEREKREKLVKKLTKRGNELDKGKLIQMAAKRTESEKEELMEKIRVEMREMKEYIVRQYIHKKVFPKGEELGKGEEGENGGQIVEEFGKYSSESDGEKEEEEEEEEEGMKDVGDKKLEFLKSHFKVYKRKHPGILGKSNRKQWVKEARNFMKELDLLIENKIEGNEEMGGESPIRKRIEREEEEEKRIKEMGEMMMTEEDVKHRMEKYIESTAEIRADLVKDFIGWIELEKISEKKLVGGTKEERKELLGEFMASIKRRDLVAKILAKTAYGLGVDHEYMEKLIPKDQYLVPPDIKGFVVRMNGVLRSTNPGIDHLVQYLQLKAKLDVQKAEEKVKMEEGGGEGESKEQKELRQKRELYEDLMGMEIPSAEKTGCFLSLRVSRKMRHYAFLFDEAVTIPQQKIEEFLERYEEKKMRDVETGAGITQAEIEAFLRRQKEPKNEGKEEGEEEEEEEEDEDERYTQITTFVLLEIIQKGRKILGEETKLEWKEMEKVENGMRTKNKWKPIVAFFKDTFDKFVQIKAFIKQKAKTFGKNMREFGKAVGTKVAEIWKKDEKETSKNREDLEKIKKEEEEREERELWAKEGRKMRKKGAEGLREMKESKFVQNDEPHARLIRQSIDTFDFLREVRYEFEALPGDIVESRLPLHTEIIQKKENPSGHVEFTSEEQKALAKGYYRAGKVFNKKHWSKKFLFADHGENRKKYIACEKLSQTLETVLYPRVSSEKEQRDDPIHYELRGRIGANILLSIMNTKNLTQEMLLGLALSLVGSGTVALMLDVVLLSIVTVILTALGPVTAGVSLGFVVPMAIIIRSLTPLFAETFDSFVIKRLMGLSRGKPFWPKSRKEMEKNIKEALLAGSISAGGSIPYNVLASIHLFAGWAWLPAKAVANFIGTATSASMVPLEVEKMGGHTGASILIKMEEGFLKKPDPEKIVQKYEEKNKKKWVNKSRIGLGKEENDPKWKDKVTRALQAYINSKTRRVMRIAKASAQAISSMGTGATFSFFFGFLFFAIPGELGWLPDTLIEVGSVICNTPTEAISMTLQTITGEAVGFSSDQKVAADRGNHFPRKWLSRDSTKNMQMMQLILDKTLLQIHRNSKEAVPIEYRQIHNVFRPLLTFTSPFGEWITNTMRRIFFFLGFVKDLKKDLDVSGMKIRTEKNVKKSGLMEEAEIIVQNWRKNVVYLVQRPRTNSSPGLAPMDLKMETWLKFRKIPFYRLTNARFLIALFGEQLPMVEFQGEQFVGSTENIIKNLEQKLRESDEVLGDPNAVLDMRDAPVETQNREMGMRRLAEKVLNRILMYDRQYSAEFEAEKLKRKEKQQKASEIKKEKRQNAYKMLDFVFRDKSILGALEREYPSEWSKIKKLKGNLRKVVLSDREFIQSKIDLEGAIDMMRVRLQIFQLEQDDAEFIKEKRRRENGVESEIGEMTYSMLGADEIVAILKRTMGKIERQLRESDIGGDGRFYLFGNKQTQADASLFAHFVLFKDLNIPEMGKYVESIMGNPGHIIRRYIDQIKRDQWGMEGKDGRESVWENLRVEPEKKLNFDFKMEKTDKFADGNAPFALLPEDILAPAANEEMPKMPNLPEELLEIERENGEKERMEFEKTLPILMGEEGEKTKEIGLESGEEDLKEEKDISQEEALWAHELSTFQNLPLPDKLEMDENKLKYFPPILREIFMDLFKIGSTGKYSAPKGEEKYSAELVETVNKILKKKKTMAIQIVRKMLRQTASYLCEKCENIDQNDEGIGHIDGQNLGKGVRVFVFFAILKWNEREMGKKLTTLGNSLVRHVKVMNAKTHKWLYRPKVPMVVRAKDKARDWLWGKIVSLLTKGEDPINKMYKEAEMKENDGKE